MKHQQLLTIMQQFFKDSLRITQQVIQMLPQSLKTENPEYEESSPSVLKKATKSVKKVRDPLAPKKPMTAFFHYCREVRSKLSLKYNEEKQTDILKRVAEQWKQLNSDKKDPYDKLAKEDKMRYAREMILYLENKGVQVYNKLSKADEEQDSYGEKPIKKLKK